MVKGRFGDDWEEYANGTAKAPVAAAPAQPTAPVRPATPVVAASTVPAAAPSPAG